MPEVAAVPPSRALPRRPASPLALVGVVAFGIGLAAVTAIMVLFATGAHDLPLALNLTAMLAPIGFGLGLVALWRETRGASRGGAAGRPDGAR